MQWCTTVLKPNLNCYQEFQSSWAAFSEVASKLHDDVAEHRFTGRPLQSAGFYQVVGPLRCYLNLCPVLITTSNLRMASFAALVTDAISSENSDDEIVRLSVSRSRIDALGRSVTKTSHQACDDWDIATDHTGRACLMG